MTLTPQPTDVAALLREVQAIFRYKVQEKHLFFRLDCPAGLPLFLLDSLRLRQILVNLTGNAREVHRGGGSCALRRFHTVRRRARNARRSRPRHRHRHSGRGAAKNFRTVRPGRFRLRYACIRRNRPRAGDLPAAGRKELRDGRADAPPPSARWKFRVLLVDDVLLNLKVLQAMLAGSEPPMMPTHSGRPGGKRGITDFPDPGPAAQPVQIEDFNHFLDHSRAVPVDLPPDGRFAGRCGHCS